MEIYLIVFVLIIVVVVLLQKVSGNRADRKKVFKNNVYRYTPKESLMTRSETEFYWRLYKISQDRYFVYPQVHLSALLDHRVKGQDWRYAFRHINGKSVDYVLCSKDTLAPAYAIELDDYTHDTPERKERDSEVERIFEEANLPLVRFRNYKQLTEDDIVNTLAQANKLAVSKK